jgi:hypothetical protein
MFYQQRRSAGEFMGEQHLSYVLGSRRALHNVLQRRGYKACPQSAKLAHGTVNDEPATAAVGATGSRLRVSYCESGHVCDKGLQT